MKKSLATLIASAAACAMASVASAGEVITLTDAELDNVTAGSAFVSAELMGDGIVFGAFLLGDLPGVGPFANIVAALLPISGLVALELNAAVEPRAMLGFGPAPERRALLDPGGEMVRLGFSFGSILTDAGFNLNRSR